MNRKMKKWKPLLSCSLLLCLPNMVQAQSSKGMSTPIPNWPVPSHYKLKSTSGNSLTSESLLFIPITPCRIADTRGTTDNANFVVNPSGSLIFGGQGQGLTPGSGIAAGATISLPMQQTQVTSSSPAPCPVLPTTALAYSFNLTVVPNPQGQGPTGSAVDYVTVWPSSAMQPVTASINDPEGGVVNGLLIVEAGTGDTGAISIFNAAGSSAAANVVIDMNGYFIQESDQNNNTSFGVGALSSISGSSEYNTAVGYNAFSTLNGSTMSITNNTMVGSSVSGSGAGITLEAGAEGNTILGSTSIGYLAGTDNTIIGAGAYGVGGASASDTASNLTLIGSGAGSNLAAATHTHDLMIDNSGFSDDDNTIRIGNSNHSTTYIAGIRNVTPVAGDAIPVFISSTGQLGTAVSSRRYKEDIQDMRDASSDLMRLRPVTFRYKKPYKDGSKPLDYGLIAEEVFQVYPDLVVKNLKGQIETVQYQKLTPMMLNELQKQHQEIEEQQKTIQIQAEENHQIEARLAALEARLSKQKSSQ